MNVKVDRTLSALSDPTRRSVVELLRTRPHRAGELARLTHSSPPAMSRHLHVLRDSGLVEARLTDEDARHRIYRLRRKPFADLQVWLDQVAAFWDDQLDSFKTHAEREQ